MRHRYRDALAEIDPLAFERLLADYYLEAGYDVDHSGTGSKRSTFDGGVDLKLRKDGQLTLVQCKRENAYQVTHNVIHELLGIKVNQGASEAIVITTGEFTDAAKRAGATGHVRLIDGVELRKLLGSRLDGLASRRIAPFSNSTPVWEPLVIVDDRPRRRDHTQRREHQELAHWKIIGALSVLVILAFLLNCEGPRRISTFHPALPVPAMTTLPLRPAPPGSSAQTFDLRAAQPMSASSVPTPLPPSADSVKSHRVSASELARQDEEMRRYLERVPEVTHYRYSPLDQNRAHAPPVPDAEGQSQ